MRTYGDSWRGGRAARRIAYIAPWTVLGGGEVATWRLACAVAEDNDFHAVAFCNGGDTEVARQYSLSSIETIGYTPAPYSYRHPLPFIQSTKRLFSELRRRQIALVHCADLMGVYHVGAAARLARVPLVCHVRSNFESIPAIYKPPIMLTDHFIFVSQATWDNFDNILRVPRRRGAVIYDWSPGTPDGSESAGTRARVRREFDIPEDAPVIGMVARVTPPKDFETLLAATARVVPTHPDVRLLLVGDYHQTDASLAYYKRLCMVIEEHRLTGHVIWTGFRQDVVDLMCAMDVVALCTNSEGFPLVMLEAMALGRPVVATKVGGIPEIISHGENGLLHMRGNSIELAGHILRLLNNPREADAIGRRGKWHVQNHFNRERTVSAVKKLYRRMLSGTSSGRVIEAGEKMRHPTTGRLLEMEDE